MSLLLLNVLISEYSYSTYLFTSCSDVLGDNIRLLVFFFFSELNNYWGYPGSGNESTNLSIFLKEKDTNWWWEWWDTNLWKRQIYKIDKIKHKEMTALVFCLFLRLHSVGTQPHSHCSSSWLWPKSTWSHRRKHWFWPRRTGRPGCGSSA